MSEKKIFTRRKNNRMNPTVDESFTASTQVISQDTNNDQEHRVRDNKKFDIVKITYTQIYQLLLSMLANNKFALEEVLKFAKILFAEGVRTPEIAKLIIRKINKEKSKEITENVITEKQPERSR
ncbi:MAG: hypothetical protein HRK26_02820 [Rickettsiaceae bacterium H1]|nr:hypothetical protein [Rickettsiaceae bacterium H1]